MRVLKIDVKQTNVEVLYKGSNLEDLIPSPDGQRILLTYFEGDLGRSELHVCLLDIQAKTCNDFKLGVYSNGDYVRWLDNRYFVVLRNQKFYVADTTNMQVK
jgi:hypothetical protein